LSGKNNKTAAERKAKDDWRTPKWLLDVLLGQYDINLDCAATAQNKVCPNWIGEDGFHMEVDLAGAYTCAWCNPPFSNPAMLRNKWVTVFHRIGIYRCDNLETKAWQQIILPSVDWVFFFSHRINYEGHEGKGSMFPSALFGANLPTPKGLGGTLVWIKGVKQ